jgi:Domain of unknown function (DUF4331)
MKSRVFAAAFAVGVQAIALAGCSNDPTLNGTSTGTFIQIDRVGRPALNTIFVPFAQHAANDRSTPGNDAQLLGPQLSTFMTQTAGRSAAVAAAAENVLLARNADVLLADFSQTGNAGYLGVETGAKIGQIFGGRALTDDVMSVNLGIAFGSALATAGLVTDDGKENNGQNGTPNLTNANLTPVRHITATFPYLGAPQ